MIDDMLDTLTEAQEKLFEAISLLEFYVRETGDKSAKAYIVDCLKIIASNNHGFLSRDLSIDDLIENLEEKI